MNNKKIFLKLLNKELRDNHPKYEYFFLNNYNLKNYANFRNFIKNQFFIFDLIETEDPRDAKYYHVNQKTTENGKLYFLVQ